MEERSVWPHPPQSSKIKSHDMTKSGQVIDQNCIATTLGLDNHTVGRSKYKWRSPPSLSALLAPACAMASRDKVGSSISMLGSFQAGGDAIPREYHRKVLKKIAQLTKVWLKIGFRSCV